MVKQPRPHDKPTFDKYAIGVIVMSTWCIYVAN